MSITKKPNTKNTQFLKQSIYSNILLLVVILNIIQKTFIIPNKYT